MTPQKETAGGVEHLAAAVNSQQPDDSISPAPTAMQEKIARMERLIGRAKDIDLPSREVPAAQPLLKAREDGKGVAAAGGVVSGGDVSVESIETPLPESPTRLEAAVKASTEENIHDAIVRLAGLHPLEYEQVREQEAKTLGARVSALDTEVLKQRPDNRAGKEGDAIGSQEAEPWPKPVDGEALFHALVSVFRKYLALQKYQAEALALWVIFSHNIDAGNIAPKLLIYSPIKRCGKTTLLDVLMQLIWRALPASNITAAAIFRTIEAIGGTLVIDEADTFIKDKPELNGIINSGHRKALAYVIRLVGDSHEPKRFSTWAPTIIAMIGKPTDTIVDRSIMIEMQRRKKGEKITRLRMDKAPELKVLASQIARWSKDNFASLKNADPATPADLHDRAADNWRPLLAIADLIGGKCPATARLAAIALSESDQDEDNGSIATVLLGDMQDIFEKERRSRISTEDLLKKLHEMDDRPWPEWNKGKAITSRQVARQLKPFRIEPRTLRMGAGTKKGYELGQFEDAFARYLPDLSVTEKQDSNTNELDGVLIRNKEQDVTEENNDNQLKNNDCSTVTDVEVF